MGWVGKGQFSRTVLGEAQLPSKEGEAVERCTEAMLESADGSTALTGIGKGKYQKDLGVDADNILIQGGQVQALLSTVVRGRLEYHSWQI